MKDFYKQFVNEELDEQGRLLSFKLNLKDNFNFSYDVIDAIAAIEPNKLAIHWVSETGEEHKFTYKDLSEMSNQVANMLLDHGVKKGRFCNGGA
jgi:acetyl-CoA synthetase